MIIRRSPGMKALEDIRQQQKISPKRSAISYVFLNTVIKKIHEKIHNFTAKKDGKHFLMIH